MSIVISDLKDALVNSGIKNKMLAKGGSLAIKLNDSNVCIITLKDKRPKHNQFLLYTIQVYQTGNTLESNYIRIPNFLPRGVTNYYDDEDKGNNIGINGADNCYGYYETYSKWRDDRPTCIYESQDLLELIPGVIEDLVEVINFYNGD